MKLTINTPKPVEPTTFGMDELDTCRPAIVVKSDNNVIPVGSVVFRTWGSYLYFAKDSKNLKAAVWHGEKKDKADGYVLRYFQPGEKFSLEFEF